MEYKIFKIAELSFVWVSNTVQIFLILLDLHKFIVVPFKEWKDSLDQFKVQNSWKIKHYSFLVLSFVLLENLFEEEFYRLVCSKLTTETQSRDEIEIWLNH